MEVAKRKFFLAGMVSALLLVGCASMFGYQYYELDGIQVWSGKLLADQPEHDLPFAVCQPKEGNQNPCVVILSSEFFRLKRDYLSLEDRLKSCEEGK
jgi:hypothetical protein